MANKVLDLQALDDVNRVHRDAMTRMRKLVADHHAHNKRFAAQLAEDDMRTLAKTLPTALRELLERGARAAARVSTAPPPSPKAA